MIGLLLLVFSLSACECAPQANAERLESRDTVAALSIAFEHYFEGVQLDSVALDVEGDHLSRSLLARVAAQLKLPMVKHSEVVSCSEDLTVFPRDCELKVWERLVRFRVDSLEEDRAVVWVSSIVESQRGGLHGAGTQYELRRSSEGWTVEKVLLQSAT